jgi:hypothetical protein
MSKDIKNEFKVAFYNVDLPLEERVEKPIIFDSVRSASAKTNLSYSVIKLAISSKKRLFIERLDGTFALRHIK